MAAPTCFISYSWDNAAHSDWVRKLADALVANGVVTHLDQWEAHLGIDLTTYMETCVRESDFVLLICTPKFANKANAGTGGVGYEKLIVTGEIFGGAASPKKFVPILRSGDAKGSLPSFLKPKLFVDFRDDAKFHASLEQLLRHIYESPFYSRPPLGPQPHFDNPMTPPSPPSADVPIWAAILKKIFPYRIQTGVTFFVIAVVAVSIGVNGLINGFSATPQPPQVGQATLTGTSLATSTRQILTAAPIPSTYAPTATKAPAQTLVPTPTSTNTPTPTRPVMATPLPGQMVTVPEGKFLMGSTPSDINLAMALCKQYDPTCSRAWYTGEQPQHTVRLDAFSIDKFEVTNADYKKCVDDGKCSLPARASSPTRSSYYGNPVYNTYPVMYVRWEDAKSYCAYAGKQLPTEAQWEKTARGSNGQIWPWGPDWDPNWANSLLSGVNDATSIGSYPDGKSPYGAMDMAGNVFEWVEDWFHGDEDKWYGDSPQDNPISTAPGPSHVLRGGAFDRWPSALRTTQRYGAYTNIPSGFRCVKR